MRLIVLGFIAWTSTAMAAAAGAGQPLFGAAVKATPPQARRAKEPAAPDEVLKRAGALVKAKRLDEATALLYRAAEKYPKHFALNCQLGMLLYQRKMKAFAAKYLVRSVENLPKDLAPERRRGFLGQVHLVLADAYGGNLFFDEADAAIDAAKPYTSPQRYKSMKGAIAAMRKDWAGKVRRGRAVYETDGLRLSMTLPPGWTVLPLEGKRKGVSCRWSRLSPEGAIQTRVINLSVLELGGTVLETAKEREAFILKVIEVMRKKQPIFAKVPIVEATISGRKAWSMTGRSNRGFLDVHSSTLLVPQRTRTIQVVISTVDGGQVEPMTRLVLDRLVIEAVKPAPKVAAPPAK